MPAPSKPASRTDILDQAQPTILIIDDETEMLMLFQRMLQHHGYHVLTAVNGQDGLEVARQHLPDLILCDIMMPIMNGHQVLEALREHSATATIPFIFLTAMATKEHIREGMNLGADDYLTKPVDRHDLVKTIQVRLIRHREVVTQRMQHFTHQLVKLQEAERERVADILHNQMYQTLMGLKVILNLSESAPAQAQASINSDAQNLLERLLQDVNNLAQDLHPALLDHLGLLPALVWLMERYELDIEFDYDQLNFEFSPQLKKATFRIIREALDNIRQHAETRQVQVGVVNQHGSLQIKVTDYGKGFHLEEALQGDSIGLMSLYERVALMRGRLQITTSAGNGTVLEVMLPLDKVSPTQQGLPLNEVERILAYSQTPAPNKTTQGVQSTTIVIALEEDVLRTGMRRLLERHAKFQVLAEVSQLDQLVSVLGQHRPHLVIINPISAEQNRHDIIQKVAQSFPDTRILVLSPQQEKAYVLDAFRYGAHGFIPQNASTNDLHSAVIQVAHGDIYLSPTISSEGLLSDIQRGTHQLTGGENLRIAELTTREREIFELIAQGKTNAAIAQHLSISVRTVETHRAHLMRKLNINGQADLVRMAVKTGVVRLD